MANNGATCGFQFVNLEFKEYQKVAGSSYYIITLLHYWIVLPNQEFIEFSGKWMELEKNHSEGNNQNPCF